MRKNTPPVTPSGSDEAMSTALQAEQRALDAIKDCEQRAAELGNDARRQTRAIAQRTDRRISALHTQRARALAEKVDTMLREDAALSAEATQITLEQKMLELAVERVAAWLTGETKK